MRITSAAGVAPLVRTLLIPARNGDGGRPGNKGPHGDHLLSPRVSRGLAEWARVVGYSTSSQQPRRGVDGQPRHVERFGTETVTRPVTSTISVGAISKSDNRIGCSASSSTYVSAMSADLRRGAAAPACAHGRMCGHRADLGRLRLVSRLSHSTVPTPGLPRFITKTPMSTTVAYFRPSFLAYLWDRRRQPQQNR